MNKEVSIAVVTLILLFAPSAVRGHNGSGLALFCNSGLRLNPEVKNAWIRPGQVSASTVGRQMRSIKALATVVHDGTEVEKIAVFQSRKTQTFRSRLR